MQNNKNKLAATILGAFKKSILYYLFFKASYPKVGSKTSILRSKISYRFT